MRAVHDRGSILPSRTQSAFLGVTGAAFLNTAAAAIFGIVTARFLMPAGLGVLTLATSVAALAALGLAVGTGLSLRLRVVDGRPPDGDVRAYVGLSFAMAPLTAVVTGGAVFLIGQGAVGVSEMVAAMCFGALTMLSRQSSDLVQAYGRTASAIVAVGLGLLAQTGLFVLFVISDQATVTTALVSGACGAAFQVAFSITLLRGLRPSLLPRADLNRWRDLVVHGAPTVGYGLGITAMQRIDRVLVVGLISPQAGGIYGVAATVAEGARVATSAIGQLLFVRTSLGRVVTPEVRHLYWAGVGTQALLLTGLLIAAPTVVPLLFGEAYTSSVRVTQGLLAAEFLMGLALMDSRIVMGLGKLKSVATATLAATAASVPIYVVLIHELGLRGAVLGCIGTYALYSGTLLWQRRRYQPRWER